MANLIVYNKCANQTARIHMLIAVIVGRILREHVFMVCIIKNMPQHVRITIAASANTNLRLYHASHTG